MADKDSLTFRIMLTKLSLVLGSRELETMKYICLNRIPRAILEEIQTPIQLWIALEERDVISPDDVSFLNTIITDACAGRQDVIQILNEYKDQSYGLKNKEGNYVITMSVWMWWVYLNPLQPYSKVLY